MAAKSKIQWIDNEKLKEALSTYKEDIAHLKDGMFLDDEEVEKIDNFRALPDVLQSIFYLYVMKGATETGELLGVSRQFIYKKINEINNKINQTKKL